MLGHKAGLLPEPGGGRLGIFGPRGLTWLDTAPHCSSSAGRQAGSARRSTARPPSQPASRRSARFASAHLERPEGASGTFRKGSAARGRARKQMALGGVCVSAGQFQHLPLPGLQHRLGAAPVQENLIVPAPPTM